MKPRRVPATKAEKARYAKLKELGCIIAWVGVGECMGLDCEVQHLTSGGRRLGNDKTIPLCAWHHRGQLPDGMTTSDATQFYGPSFAKSRREFESCYGSEEYLLKRTNELLEGAK